MVRNSFLGEARILILAQPSVEFLISSFLVETELDGMISSFPGTLLHPVGTPCGATAVSFGHIHHPSMRYYCTVLRHTGKIRYRILPAKHALQINKQGYLGKTLHGKREFMCEQNAVSAVAQKGSGWGAQRLLMFPQCFLSMLNQYSILTGYWELRAAFPVYDTVRSWELCVALPA